jgi:hypothetical protein
MKISPTLLIIALVGSLVVAFASHFLKGKNDGAKVCSFDQSFCMIHMCIIITL